MSCQGCGGSINFFSGNPKDKLGKCPFCIIASALGTFAGWTFFLSFYFIAPTYSDFINVVLYISLFFTALLSAHGIGYLIKKNKNKK